MRTIRRLFSILVFVALVVGFANLKPSHYKLADKTTHVATVQAPKKIKTHITTTEPKKPPNPIVIHPDKAIKTEQPIAKLTTHKQLMAAAGIPVSSWAAADRVITIESSWDWSEVEPTTGACGLQQENPCGKSGCAPSNEICGLRWANQYVLSRYGSWQAALGFHLVHNWY